MIKPKKESENLRPSNTEICEKLIEQTHRKAEETLEFKLTKSRETFSFKPPISIEGSWMIELTSLEVYNSIFKATGHTKTFKFEVFTDNFDEFSFEELKDEFEDILNISDITPYHPQHEIILPRII